MNLAFFLKIFSDICYYLAFACFFGSTFGQESFLMPAAALLALCALLSRLIDEKKPNSLLRFLPLLLLGALAADPPDIAGYIVLILPAGYVIYSVWRRRFTPSYYEQIDKFSLMLKVAVLPLIAALLLMEKARIERFSLPYLVAFLLCSVFLLRLLRHDEETMSRPQFRIMNLLALPGAVLTSLILFSRPFRRAVLKILSLLLGGVASLIYYLFKPLIPLIDRVFEWLKGFMTDKAQTPPPVYQDYQTTNPPFEPHFPVPDTPPKDLSTVWTILIILFALALLAGAVLLFRKLLAEHSSPRREPGSVRRLWIPAPEKRKERPSRFGRTPAQKVRYWYRQHLILTQKSGGLLKPTLNTLQQQQTADVTLRHSFEEHARLRELYLSARYAGRATEQDAKEAQALYHAEKKTHEPAKHKEDAAESIKVSPEALREMLPKKSGDQEHENIRRMARPQNIMRPQKK